MTDEAFRFRLRGALCHGVDKLFDNETLKATYDEASSLEKWEMVADSMMTSLSTADRMRLEIAFDNGRVPGFREANDEIWKATGKVFTVEVDKDTKFITKAYLAPQTDREV